VNVLDKDIARKWLDGWNRAAEVFEEERRMEIRKADPWAKIYRKARSSKQRVRSLICAYSASGRLPLG